MRALIVLTATVGIAACDPIERANPESTILILQCDGEATSGSGADLRRYEHRNTMRFDLAAGSVTFWSNEEQKFSKNLPGIREKLEVSLSKLVYHREFGDDYSGARDVLTFNRTLGTLSERGESWVGASDLGPAINEPNTFEGKCQKIDHPSTERVF
jgi:hypothetical protein